MLGWVVINPLDVTVKGRSVDTEGGGNGERGGFDSKSEIEGDNQY